VAGIPLRIIEAPEEGAGYDGVEPGDMWAWGPPGGWLVMLPNRATWGTWEHAAGTGKPWDITGDAPNLTVTPSILDPTPGNGWHGWIRNGELVPA
jgi:hypothetical protein